MAAGRVASGDLSRGSRLRATERSLPWGSRSTPCRRISGTCSAGSARPWQAWSDAVGLITSVTQKMSNGQRCSRRPRSRRQTRSRKWWPPSRGRGERRGDVEFGDGRAVLRGRDGGLHRRGGQERGRAFRRRRGSGVVHRRNARVHQACIGKRRGPFHLGGADLFGNYRGERLGERGGAAGRGIRRPGREGPGRPRTGGWPRRRAIQEWTTSKRPSRPRQR